MIKLSKRLSSVAQLVGKNMRLADVGTDHGYIPIYLIQAGEIAHGIAMDVNRGPLLRAQEHIRNEKLETYIDTRLSDGLSTLIPGEVDSVVIAGMGGNLMMRILREGEAVVNQLTELILQPQSEVEEVRRFLKTAGWSIVAEDIVEEDGKYYFPMKAQPILDHQNSSAYSEADYRYGRLLIKAKHPVLLEYLEKEEAICIQIRDSLSRQEMTPAIIQRKEELAKRIGTIHQALREMA